MISHGLRFVRQRPQTVRTYALSCGGKRSHAVLCCDLCVMQFALRKLRGEHDAFNVCVAGTLSAGFLGATCECEMQPLDWELVKCLVIPSAEVAQAIQLESDAACGTPAYM
jgi:hypothetical protein